MPAAIDISGHKFGMLTAIRRTDKQTKSGQWIWECGCDCGNKAEIRIGNLRRGKTKSCGCQQRAKGEKSPNYRHGLSNKSHPEYKRYQRECFDKCRYGLEPETKAAMIEAQNNKCAICGYQFGQKIGDMHVDHCHTTGKVRGLLCDLCNRGLGYFCDSPDNLNTAAQYLARAR